ncbi:MAG: LysR family transcriptional regulator [Burkholderiaceae bacterium]|nr:LysR family transcriptional regulator [Burkholderiaceae bacterium]
MDTKWLYDFIALVENGSFTQAADYRHSSQAAFSRRIQSLEHWVGTKLIDRSVYPVELTPDGRNLYRASLDITNQLEDVRADLAPSKSTQTVRIASTYVLASTNLPRWWRHWSEGTDSACVTTVGNILETTSAFTAGLTDILISYNYPLYPAFNLEDGQYERTVISTETLAPYGSKKLLSQGDFMFPGSVKQPVPLLAYSQQSYFYKVVKQILDESENTLHYAKTFESAMSSTLSVAAQQGLGVAWLTDASVLQDGGQELEMLDDTPGQVWSREVDVIAFIAQSNRRKHVRHIWDGICRGAQA